MRKKSISLIVVLTFLMTLFPLALPAMAADYSRVGSVLSVSDDEVVKLNRVKGTFSVGELVYGDEVILRLPSDFEFCKDAAGNAMAAGDWTTSSACSFKLETDQDTPVNINYSVTKLDDNEFKFRITDAVPAKDINLFINLDKVYVDKGFDGDIKLTFDAVPGSGFDSGEVVVGRVTGGEVSIEVVDDETFGDDGGEVTLRLKEDRAGAYEQDAESVKLILPDGFEWKSIEEVKLIYGDAAFASSDIDIAADPEEMVIDVTYSPVDKASCIEIRAKIEVADETDAKAGDVVAKVKGESDLTPSTIVVGKYGDYDVEVTAEDPTIVYAGKIEQEIANITIEETIGDSLINGRSITLTLPEWAKWGKLDGEYKDGSTTVLDDLSFPGRDGRVAKYQIVDAAGNGAKEVELKDVEVVLSPDAPEGDLEVEIAGSSAVEATVKVAEVKKPVVVEVTADPTIVIGKADQAIAEITITEAAEGMFNDGEALTVKLPKDVDWDDYDVEVLEGDLEIGDVDADDNLLTIEIDDDSNDISKLKITGSVVAFRSVPEGIVEAGIGGNAIIEVNAAEPFVNDYYGWSTGNYWAIDGEQAIKWDEDGLWEKDDTVADVKVAYVGTPAPGETQIKAVFTLGSTTFKLNDVDQTMDVAPYAKNGRTYLPMRYVAKALGIKDSGILWKAGTATFISGNKVVSVKVGSSVMTINGAPVSMDVAPEIVSGRVMIPIKWIATAFDVDVAWDAATQQVTVE